MPRFYRERVIYLGIIASYFVDLRLPPLPSGAGRPFLGRSLGRRARGVHRIDAVRALVLALADRSVRARAVCDPAVHRRPAQGARAMEMDRALQTRITYSQSLSGNGNPAKSPVVRRPLGVMLKRSSIAINCRTCCAECHVQRSYNTAKG